MSNPTNFDTLIANYQNAEQTVNDLAILWDKPICGVPHFGFKAARKARATRLAASVQLSDATTALRNYVRGDTKLNYKRRLARFESIKAVIPTFTLD